VIMIETANKTETYIKAKRKLRNRPAERAIWDMAFHAIWLFERWIDFLKKWIGGSKNQTPEKAISQPFWRKFKLCVTLLTVNMLSTRKVPEIPIVPCDCQRPEKWAKKPSGFSRRDDHATQFNDIRSSLERDWWRVSVVSWSGSSSSLASYRNANRHARLNKLKSLRSSFRQDHVAEISGFCNDFSLALRGRTALHEPQILHIPMINRPDFSGFAEKKSLVAECSARWEKVLCIDELEALRRQRTLTEFGKTHARRFTEADTLTFPESKQTQDADQKEVESRWQSPKPEIIADSVLPIGEHPWREAGSKTLIKSAVP